LEIAPVPHRSVRGERRRLAIGLLVLAPVVLLVLLPTVLGLDRYVVTERAAGSPGRGSVVLAREVPPTDLRVGDVITFRPADSDSADRVTSKVVSIEDGVATTQDDGSGADALEVPLTGSSYARVWLSVPWIGYPFLMDGGWLLLALAAASALSLAVAAGRRNSHRVVRPTRQGLPVS
jgi:signal peptidase I